MLKNLQKYLPKFLFPVFLVIIWVVLVSKNYVPNTILSGWDTLHPEFNFPLNFMRVISGVWREDQGVGVVAVHSHMSDLPRIFILWLASFVIQVNSLRYLYIFLCLLLGPLGIYFLLKSVFKEKSKSVFLVSLAAFLGAAYYIFNLSTLQNFYVPFEMFSTQFAYLPWILLFSILYIKEGGRKNLFFLFITALLATPQAYAATLFYAFIGCFSAFPGLNFVLSKNKKIVGKRSIMILLFILCANAFWILPNLYSVEVQSQSVINSNINSLFSNEAFLRNQDYGNLENVIIHKSFLFSWRAYDAKNGGFVDLMKVWNQHLANPYVSSLGYFLAAFFIVGFLISLFKRDKLGISLGLFGLIAMFFLINDNFPTGPVYLFLQRISLFREGFRMPFTKFSIIFLNAAAFYFGYFFISLFSVLPKKYKFRNLFSFLTSVIVFGMLIYYCLPFFTGNLISPLMRVTFPKEYVQVSEWLNSQPAGRIAKLPLNTIWGWDYYSWGYQGSGFKWFSLASPQFDRDSDRFTPFNESFYSELSNTYYTHDEAAFLKTLQKYQVRYLFLDKSIIDPGGDQRLIDYEDIEKFLSESSKVTLAYQAGSLSIYKTNLDISDTYLYGLKSYAMFNDDASYNKFDLPYLNYGDYVNSGQGDIFPFLNFDRRSDVSLEVRDKDVVVGHHFEKPVAYKQLIAPDYLKSEKDLSVFVYGRLSDPQTLEIKLLTDAPTISLNGKELDSPRFIWRTDSFNIGSQDVSFLSVNKTIFPLNLSILSEQDKLLGTAYLAVPEDVSVGVYQKQASVVSDIQNGILQKDLRLCADSNKVFPLDVTATGFQIEVGDKSKCLGHEFKLPTDALLSVAFESSSPNNSLPEFCVSRAGIRGCANDYTNLVKVEKGEHVYNIALAASDDYWFDFVAPGNKVGISKINYSNLSTKVYRAIKVVHYNFGDAFGEVSQDYKKQISEPITDIKVGIPIISKVSEDFSLNRGNLNASNCDLDQIGQVSKKNLGNAVDYGAFNGGVSCDYFDYPQLSANQGYILHLVGENVMGRSIKIYLQNRISGRIEMEQLLPSGKFDQSYFIVPSGDFDGYVLNIETRSFGRLPAENILSKVEFIPFPYGYLSKIMAVNSESGITKGSSNLEVSNIQKAGTFLYRANVDGNGVLVLAQGYEEGWIAFSNGKILPHVKINSWENGWTINSGSLNKGARITILYWPQMLEFAGFGLLFLPILALIVKPHKHK